MRQVTDTTYRRAICTAMPNGILSGSDQREIYGYCKRTVARFAQMQHPGRADCPHTAPCIAYACWKIKKQHPQANIVVTPSDALVINTGEFQRETRCATRFYRHKLFHCNDRHQTQPSGNRIRLHTGCGTD